MSGNPTVTIYSDGGASPNPGPGGWGVLLIAANGATKELSGADPDTTNNRMELTAALEALRALKQPCQVEFHTDSEYLRTGITEWLLVWVKKGWQRRGDRPVQNEDLWRALSAETQRHAINWHWVKGHAGNEFNERVDRLATAAREALTGSLEVAIPVDYEIALRVSVRGSEGPGGWAIRLRDAAAGSSTVLSGRDDPTTANRITLLAALEALRATPPGAAVRVYCANSYLRDGITTWVHGWQRSGWTTKGGAPVKHRDLWQAIVEESGRRTVRWVMEGGESLDLAQGLDKLAAG